MILLKTFGFFTVSPFPSLEHKVIKENMVVYPHHYPWPVQSMLDQPGKASCAAFKASLLFPPATRKVFGWAPYSLFNIPTHFEFLFCKSTSTPTGKKGKNTTTHEKHRMILHFHHPFLRWHFCENPNPNQIQDLSEIHQHFEALSSLQEELTFRSQYCCFHRPGVMNLPIHRKWVHGRHTRMSRWKLGSMVSKWLIT